MKRRGLGQPEVPDWVRHEADGGFVVADWIEPGDFMDSLELVEQRAKGRWIRARVEWLNEHGDVADQLLEQLQSWCVDDD